MQKLTQQTFKAARNWLDEHGRPLEQALCAMLFDNASPEAVVEALSAYQNDDGGYGHRLEPDHTDDASTVLNTSVALAIHRRLATPSDHRQITNAVSYLEASYDRRHQVWPIRFPIQPGAEGPPWFAAESLDDLMASFGGCRINPTAEIVGYLHDHWAPERADWLQQATDHLMQSLLDPDTLLSHHDLLCATQLLRSPALASAWRSRLQERLSVALPAAIESDITQWHGYAFRPTLLIDEPSHPLACCIPQELLHADLAFEINRISAHGAWQPFWNWGEETPAWQEAQRAWSSVLTERTLRVLAAFDRI